MTDFSNLPDIPWVKDIPRMDDDDLKARLLGLPAEIQAEVVISLGWDDRLKVIRNSDAAREIVQSLPDEEVFFTLKGVEEGEALRLVELTTPGQLRFILDMELWTGDRLDGDKAREWLEHVLGCGEDKVIELLEHSDRELQTIMISKLLTLVPNEEGVSVPQGLSSIMPDEFFTILSSFPEDTENLKLLLRIIRGWDRDRFYELLFDIYGKSGTEAEEEALRWRNSRLEEKGLLEFDEAIEIYAYIGEDEARRLAEEALAGDSSGGTAPDGSRARPAADEAEAEKAGHGAPIYPVVLAEARTLFYKTLRSIEDPSQQNRLRSELAFSANRLLVADAERIGEIEAVKSSLRRLFSMANVGLLFLSGGEERRAREIVEAMSVKELFQVGFSRAADLGSMARRIAGKWWPKWKGKGFPLLGFPGDEVLSGALRRIPQYYDRAEEGTPGFRDFATFGEVVGTRRTLEEIGIVAETVFDHLGLPYPHEADLGRETDSEAGSEAAAEVPAEAHLEDGGVFMSDLEDVTMASLLTTGLVHFTLKGSFEALPLSREDLDGMFGRMLEHRASGGRRVRTETVERYLNWLAGQTGFEAGKLQVLSDFVRAAVGYLEEEIKGFDTAAEFAPRYVRSLIVTKLK
ncbi:MAG: DUF6178 family protein [bacterium]